MNAFRRLVSIAIAAAAVAWSVPGFALEPGNDKLPWNTFGFFDTTVYSSTGAGARFGQGYEQIASSSDVDYVVVTCAGRPVRSVSIEFTHAKGDLDMVAFDLAGAQLGKSNGTTNVEVVNVQGQGKQVVVMKVYGFQGAAGAYDVLVYC
jgi:hypothetical protein